MKRKLLLIFLIIVLLLMGNNIFRRKLVDSRNIDIFIDPGHGGQDPGTIGRDGVYEKDLNLEIGRRLAEELKSRGYRVHMTREEDLGLKSMERVRMANEKGASIFVSIHCNAAENKEEMEGLQVLYFPSQSSRELAESLLEPILYRSSAVNQGLIERRDLIVLNQTKMPAVIVETGFLSNRQEGYRLTRGSYQKKLAKGIADGIDIYYKNLGKFD